MCENYTIKKIMRSLKLTLGTIFRRFGKRSGLFLLTAFFGNFIVICIRYLVYKKENPFFLFHEASSHITSGHARDLMSSQGIELSEKMDWNNYTLMALDRIRMGVGEHGKAVATNLSVADKNFSQSLYNKHKFNALLSSQISLQRSIGDLRDEMCQRANFTKHIPHHSVSFIIPFYNEHTSTILRTAYSIINRTPKSLLREIVLVDDFSDLPELKSPLDSYIAQNNLHNIVKILRNVRRIGLISSRGAGADASSGRFLVFLDSHMEINYNFVPPLIEPILLNSKTVTCPIIDNIDRYDFSISRIEYKRNAFRWDMKNEHFKIFPEDAANLPAPFPTPVMMGGAFAIDRKWWVTIGMYDPELDVWGGEQYELSFKIWMCGGTLLNVPCSRVAHLFRQQPYPIVTETYSRNLKRVAVVWMDEYANYLYSRISSVRKADPGDLSDRMALRRSLKCKSFDWYIKNIAYDVLYNWPVIEPPILAWGALRPKLKPDYCVKFSPNDQRFDTVFVEKCERKVNDFMFEYSWRKTIKEWSFIRCLETRRKDAVSVHHFRLNATQQQFVWDIQTGWIVSVSSGYCLRYNPGKAGVDMKSCANDLAFSWMFGGYNKTLVDAQWELFNTDWKPTR